MERLTALRAPADPVMAGVHLYALELTRARREIGRGVAHVLREQGLKDPHLAGQLAGFTGGVLLEPGEPRPARPPARALQPRDLDRILKVAQKEGEQP